MGGVENLKQTTWLSMEPDSGLHLMTLGSLPEPESKELDT